MLSSFDCFVAADNKKRQIFRSVRVRQKNAVWTQRFDHAAFPPKALFPTWQQVSWLGFILSPCLPGLPVTSLGLRPPYSSGGCSVFIVKNALRRADDTDSLSGLAALPCVYNLSAAAVQEYLHLGICTGRVSPCNFIIVNNMHTACLRIFTRCLKTELFSSVLYKDRSGVVNGAVSGHLDRELRNMLKLSKAETGRPVSVSHTRDRNTIDLSGFPHYDRK